MDTLTMDKDTVAKAIRKNGLQTMLVMAPARTRYYLTHELVYVKEKNNG